MLLLRSTLGKESQFLKSSIIADFVLAFYI